MSANGDNGESNKRSGRRGPKRFADDAASLLKHHLSARGFAQVELVTRWAEIAGQTLAEHCFPYRLSQGGANGSTLTLVADDRAALELQHQTPKVIDKINSYFGKAVVSKIKVVAGDIPRPPVRRAAKRPLSADEESALAARLEAVEGPELRAALARLGRHALSESRKPVVYKR
ncbi:MAG: DUF721 domain-containing protein [Alphaproteobacteria bacterium]|nr:DUF721 domain-containing protein [Alphaproteobacteria bacterium]